MKTLVLTALVITSNVVGNLLLSAGVKRELFALLVAGVLVLIFWTLLRLTLLSRADLTYVLPVTSLGYALNALAGKIFLAEQVSPRRWLGTLLIVAGCAVVGRTRPATRTMA